LDSICAEAESVAENATKAKNKILFIGLLAWLSFIKSFHYKRTFRI
jgi:hypothetical protein